jgi:phospholipid/cholesterol/gamma-HCH transport system substrate-binding protein
MEREPDFTPVPKNLQFRVGLLLGLTVVIAVGFVLFVLYTRGTFEAAQRLTLVADNAEGVAIGMDLTFSGFPIGRVTRIRLRDDGRARIEIRVPSESARWLKTTTIFTLERGLVGGAKIRAITSNLQDPPLPDGAERTVLRGDTQEEIPRLVANLRGVLENLEEMTKAGGSLQASLANLRAVTEKMAGKTGALGAVLGSDEEARKVTAAIERANSALKHLDDVLAKTDQRVFGAGGVMDGTQQALAQTNAILGEARESLRKVDAILADAQVTSANAKAASADLGALRVEVDATVRRISGLIEEINRKWPFERKTEIKLP